MYDGCVMWLKSGLSFQDRRDEAVLSQTLTDAWDPRPTAASHSHVGLPMAANMCPSAVR